MDNTRPPEIGPTHPTLDPLGPSPPPYNSVGHIFAIYIDANALSLVQDPSAKW